LQCVRRLLSLSCVGTSLHQRHCCSLQRDRSVTACLLLLLLLLAAAGCPSPSRCLVCCSLTMALTWTLVRVCWGTPQEQEASQAGERGTKGLAHVKDGRMCVGIEHGVSKVVEWMRAHIIRDSLGQCACVHCCLCLEHLSGLLGGYMLACALLLLLLLPSSGAMVMVPASVSTPRWVLCAWSMPGMTHAADASTWHSATTELGLGLCWGLSSPRMCFVCRVLLFWQQLCSSSSMLFCVLMRCA
jgi:hypothetical protein